MTSIAQDAVAAATQTVKESNGVRQINDIHIELRKQKDLLVAAKAKEKVSIEATRHEKRLRIQAEEDAERCKTEQRHQERLFNDKVEKGKANQVREVKRSFLYSSFLTEHVVFRLP